MAMWSDRLSLGQVLRAVARLGFALFVGCAVPGLWILAGEPGWPGYFTALQVHVWAGNALLVVALPSLLAHLWVTGSRPFLSLLAAAAPLCLLWWLFERGAGLHLGLDGYFYPAISTGAAAGVSLIALLALAAGVQLLPRLERPVSTRWSGVLLALLAGTAVGLGREAMEGRGDTRWGAIVGHSAIGLATIVATAPHFRLIQRRFAGKRLLAIPVSLAAVLLISAVWALQTDRKYFSGFREDGAERRWQTLELAVDKPPNPLMPPTALGQSVSCGESGCHEEITAQWQGSAHRFAADNELYGAAVARLVRDAGSSAAIDCANCHDPERALGGTVEADYASGTPPPGDGVSCIACHAAYDAALPAGNGIARFRVPRRYPGATAEARRKNLLADPRLHRQSMQASRHLMGDTGCGVCHRMERELVGGGHVLLQNPYREEGDPGPEQDEDQARVSCGLCHMPTQTPQQGGRMPLYNHRWPGLNVDLAAYVSHPEADSAALAEGKRATEFFMRGQLRPFGLPDDASDNPEFASYQKLASGAGLLAVALEARRSGDEVVVLIRSTNHRAAHPFPIGPFDLQEVWLQVRVVDADGVVLASVGDLLEGRVDPAAPRLGARELDAQGHPLREHRLTELASVQDKRIVWPQRSVEDRVRLPVARDSGTLRIEAQWYFRRVNPDFAEFAFGSPDAIDRFGVHPVGGSKLLLE